LPCFGCLECHCYIGARKSYTTCLKDCHVWYYGGLDCFRDPNTQSEAVSGCWSKVVVDVCQGRHFWWHKSARDSSCPVCQRTPTYLGKKVDVFCPDPGSVGFDDIDWSLTLPFKCRIQGDL
jgi:hypothetical protein